MQFLIQMAYITQGGFHYYYTLFGIFNNDVKATESNLLGPYM